MLMLLYKFTNLTMIYKISKYENIAPLYFNALTP